MLLIIWNCLTAYCLMELASIRLREKAFGSECLLILAIAYPVAVIGSQYRAL